MRSWTNEKINLLRELYPDPNLSVHEISSRMDMSIKSIQTKASRLGISRLEVLNPWSKEEIDLLRDSYPNQEISIADMSIIFGRTEDAITRMANKKGIYRNSNRWTDDDSRKLQELYANPDLSLSKIALEMGKSTPNISLMAARIGLDHRSDIRPDMMKRERSSAKAIITHRPNTKVRNESAFASDTPDAAYWAGFLMADGSIYQTGPRCFRIQLQISTVDIGHLKSFREFVDCINPVRPTTRERSQFRFSSSIMAADLERWGVIQNKTYDGIGPNNISQEMLPHFLRGLIDGDGWIDVKNFKIGIVNNSHVISMVANSFENIGIRTSTYIKQCNEKTGHKTINLHIGGLENVQAAIRWLQYDNQEAQALPRKRERALYVLSRKDRH